LTAEGSGLATARPAGARALAGVAILFAGAALGAAAGADGALTLAFSIKGMIVDLEAGFNPDVWSMTKSAPVLATTNGKTALAAFLTSPFLSSRQFTTGVASGCKSEVEGGGSAVNFSATHPSTAARKTGLVVSQADAKPGKSESSVPDASAIADNVLRAAVLVMAFWSAQTDATAVVSSLLYLSKDGPMPVAILVMIPKASILTDKFVSAIAFRKTVEISPDHQLTIP